ncbi:hypothetical protein EA82_02763 [Enterococcus hirae]|uniref:YiiX/YebB-like N1pC/P60 family cysteine hydrolase n=1 Tax=Enterococcus hirae TaxID=1354 RepID=UPI000DEB5002|nr:YiiX/YebB-like N1pC/P60 family cysteine hydrolase [Enterococcus hirae]RBT66250.1 hypothetical protein EA82_02763 [Enterococcus hirae]
MKLKFLLVTFLWTLLLAVPATHVSGETTTDEQLTEYYDFFKNEYASFDQTFEEFTANYYQQNALNDTLPDEEQLKAYLQSVNEQYLPAEAERLEKIAPLWSFNIGNSLDKLTFEENPNYSTYDLLNTVQPGDVIFEKNRAGNNGLFLHHVMIVEGIYEETHLINGKEETFRYIRTIEATKESDPTEFKPDGVVYGVLDDTRFDYTEAIILRISSATTLQKNAAITFMKSQLGKPYSVGNSIEGVLNHRDRKSSRKNWYCSMLVWVAYMNATPDGRIDELTPPNDSNFQGIDLETDDLLNEPGVTPNDILRSNKVEKTSPSFADYKYYLQNVISSPIGGPAIELADFTFRENSNVYNLRNNYRFIAIDKNNQKPYVSTELTLGRTSGGSLVAQLDIFTKFLLTDEAKEKYADSSIPVIPKMIATEDIPNYVMNWINTYTHCSFDVVYSQDITTALNHLRYNPSYTKIAKKAHPINNYQVNQVVHTPPPFTQQRFDYTENLTVYEHYELSNPNPVFADISHNKMAGGWYYFYNNFYALVRLENGTYRYATYLRFHGSFSTAVAERNGYGLNYDYTMTAEGKEKYGNYYNNIVKNQSVDFGIDWLNQYTKESTLIVFSKDIDKDITRLNQGTATVGKRFNDKGQCVYCIL